MTISRWSAQDALVLKAITLVLTEELKPKLSQNFFHLAGNGGSKQAVNKFATACKHFKFVLKSDVNSYYTSINHTILLEQLEALIDDTRVIALISRMLDRIDDVNGYLMSATQGITKGCPLSPLLGAVYLSPLDEALENFAKKDQAIYVCFMDDWVLLCKTRHQLRNAVKVMNVVLNK